jgi:hypothetical protein
MVIEKLSSEDQESILQCMRAIADGPYIDDWEMHTRLGITRETLKQIISLWPKIEDDYEGRDKCSDGFLAINNCMNEVCNGVHIPPQEWENWFKRTRSEVLQSYHNWLRLGGIPLAGIR